MTRYVLLAALALTGCGEKYPRDCHVQGEVTYMRVAPVLAANCTRCHASSRVGGDRHGAPSGVDFDDATSAALHAVRANAELLDGNMPEDDPGSVPDEEACLIEAWIDQGLKP